MNPDSGSIELARAFARRVAGSMRLSEAYLFGSRARGAAAADSDFDVILVSPDFESVERFRREPLVYPHWDYSVAGLDVLCYTPEEFARSRAMLTIVADALPSAVRID